MKKSCLVIGGSGFLGGYLTRELVSRNYKTQATYCSNLPGKFQRSFPFNLMKVDLLNKNNLDDACRNIDYIFLSTNINPNNISQSTYDYAIQRLNTEGVLNVIQAAIRSRVKKIIFISSVSAMGRISGKEVYDEHSALEPHEAYGKSKAEAERILLEYYQKGLIDVSILRPSSFYGRGSLGPLGTIIFFMKKRIVPIIGNGENLFSITYVGNVVDAAIALSESTVSSGSTYIISDEKPCTINELITTVGRELKINYKTLHIPRTFVLQAGTFLDLFSRTFNTKMPLSRNSLESISTNQVFKIDKIKNGINFTAKFNLTEGIRLALDPTLETH